MLKEELTMNKSGLTLTMIFLAESANYGEGIGNISTLKKMSRGDYEQYSYISRQAMRYNIIQQLGWDNTPVDNKSGVVQFAPSATIKDYPEIDLFGYMKTSSKEAESKGGASTRSAVVRLSNAIALEPYQSDLEFLTNMGMAKRQNLDNGIAQSEIHRSYYTYTVTIDLDRIGIDNEINIPNTEKAVRVKDFLDAVQYLYRDIKGRRENLSPVFAIGGVYQRKNPFFENRINVKENKIVAKTLEEIINDSLDVKENTVAGVTSGIFANDEELKQKLDVKSVGSVFEHLKKEVDAYYGESN
jgi:CRISPR-associated protein Cst2